MARRHVSAYIGVVGTSSPTEREAATALQVGELLARAGALVVCGGLGGIMESVCRGVRAGGGLSVGLLPGETRSDANDLVDIALPTGLGELRNGLIVRASDAVIAVGGGPGTLSEIAFALRTEVPVVGIETWDLERPNRASGIVRVGDAVEAVEKALDLARVRRGSHGSGWS